MKPRRALPAALLTALVVTGVALTACSSEIEGTPRSAGERVPVTEEGDSFSLPGDDDAPQDPELARFLITLDDLPPGWTEAAPEEEDDDGSDEFDECIDGVEPPDFLQETLGGIKGEAETEFTGPDDISTVSQTLSEMEFADDTGIFLDALDVIFGECSGSSIEVDGETAQVTVTSLPLPGVGDDARSWRMDLELGIGFTIEAHFAAIAQDNFVTLLIVLDPFGDGRTGLESLAPVAVRKLS